MQRGGDSRNDNVVGDTLINAMWVRAGNATSLRSPALGRGTT